MIETIKTDQKMNIDVTPKTDTLLGHFLESNVKSITYNHVFIEWE
jgi:hypothetical protein